MSAANPLLPRLCKATMAYVVCAFFRVELLEQASNSQPQDLDGALGVSQQTLELREGQFDQVQVEAAMTSPARTYL